MIVFLEENMVVEFKRCIIVLQPIPCENVRSSDSCSVSVERLSLISRLTRGLRGVK